MIPKLKTLLINLDRSPQRLQLMQQRLEKTRLSWQRVPAVEGKFLNIVEDPRVSLSCYRKRHGKVLNPAEVGCYLSHIKALETFLADPAANFALILEDDIDFAADFTHVLHDLLAHAAAWDMVKLSGFHSGTPVGGPTVGQKRRLSVMLSRQTGSAAYLVNRHAAEIYLAKLLPMQLPYDHAFDKGWDFGLRIRIVNPLPTELDWEQPSTIGGVDASPYVKLPWHQRLSTYQYRLFNELRRVAHGLRQWLIIQ